MTDTRTTNKSLPSESERKQNWFLCHRPPPHASVYSLYDMLFFSPLCLKMSSHKASPSPPLTPAANLSLCTLGGQSQEKHMMKTKQKKLPQVHSFISTEFVVLASGWMNKKMCLFLVCFPHMSYKPSRWVFFFCCCCFVGILHERCLQFCAPKGTAFEVKFDGTVCALFPALSSVLRQKSIQYETQELG